MRDLLAHRASLILGEFGAGKTEVTIALALQLAEQGLPVTIVDLDIVTPYFRSRDARQRLDGAGVEVIAPGGDLAVSELPAIPPAMGAAIRQGIEGARTVLVDLGGSVPGARALSHLLSQLDTTRLQGILVLNRNRPEGQTEGARRLLRDLAANGIPVTHMLSNTHLCAATTLDEWRPGLEWARAFAREQRLPLIAAGIPSGLLDRVGAEEGVPLIPVTHVLRFPWEV